MESLAKPPPGPGKLPKFYPPLIVGAIIVMFSGAVAGLVHWLELKYIAEAAREWTATTGNAIQYEVEGKKRSSGNFVVSINYRSPVGIHVMQTESMTMSEFREHFPGYAQNEEVQIFYDPAQPAIALWNPVDASAIARRKMNRDFSAALISLVLAIGLIVGYKIEKRSNQSPQRTATSGRP